MCMKRVSSLKCFAGGRGVTIYLRVTIATTNTALPPKPGRSVPAVATEDIPDGHAPTAQLQLAVNTGRAHGETAHGGHTGGVFGSQILRKATCSARRGLALQWLGRGSGVFGTLARGFSSRTGFRSLD